MLMQLKLISHDNLSRKRLILLLNFTLKRICNISPMSKVREIANRFSIMKVKIRQGIYKINKKSISINIHKIIKRIKSLEART